MQRYKFQALVTPALEADSDMRMQLVSGSHRMVLRAESNETHQTQVFSALVDGRDEGTFRPGNPEVMVTLRVIGEDVADYVGIGSHFSLWRGSPVGEGVVTRRLFV